MAIPFGAAVLQDHVTEKKWIATPKRARNDVLFIIGSMILDGSRVTTSKFIYPLNHSFTFFLHYRIKMHKRIKSLSKNMFYTFVIMLLCFLTADANAVQKEGGKTATALSLLRNVQACEGKTPTSVDAIKQSCTDLSNECNILENDPKLESDEQRAMLFQQCAELIQPCTLIADSCLKNNETCLKSSDGDNCKSSFFKDTANTFAEFLKNLP